MAFAFEPFLVMFGKGFQRLDAYTVYMPIGVDEIYLFLTAVTAVGL